MFLSFNEIVDDIILYGLDTKAKSTFRGLVEAELIALHVISGRAIRDKYRLTDVNNPLTMLNYVPDIQMGVDMNPKHPETTSYRVVHTIWQRLK